MVEPVRHRQTKEAGTDMFEPKATAPHLDSTATTFIITHSPSRSNGWDGLAFLRNAGGEQWSGPDYVRHYQVHPDWRATRAS
jgi:hypothetical protein